VWVRLRLQGVPLAPASLLVLLLLALLLLLRGRAWWARRLHCCGWLLSFSEGLLSCCENMAGSSARVGALPEH
jgi:hypothetical protein